MPGVIFDSSSNVKTPRVRKPVYMLKSRSASFKKNPFHSAEKIPVLKEAYSPTNLSKGNSGSATFSQYGSLDNKYVKVHERSKEQLSLKELNPQDKKRVANLVKELAKVGEEQINAEERLQIERKAFDERLVILQEEYDAVLKEKQYLKKRFLELQALLVKYQVNGKTSSLPKPVQAREDKENQK
ncbi:uncharacterized protein LOC141873166 isoform X2 [Acropora palmata]|uniref:uncharacterized protein LOC141873166 isoform X2 n=1 Tax=Acropora palmata TaxID=6131 RepID=UPI003D9FD986